MIAAGITLAGAGPAHADLSNPPGAPSMFAEGTNLLCKTFHDTNGYGSFWEVSMLAASNPGSTVGMEIWVQNGSTVVDRAAVYSINGRWALGTVWASISAGDVFYQQWGAGDLAGHGFGTGKVGPYSFSAIATC